MRQCRSPHLHVCHRPGNPNGAEAKTKHAWRTENGTVTGGLIKRVSPAMIHTYFEYLTSEYPREAGHGPLSRVGCPGSARTPAPASRGRGGQLAPPTTG